MLRRSKLASAGVALALSTTLGVLPAMAANAAPPTTSPAAVAQAPAAPTALPVTGTGFVGQISDLTVRTVDGVLQLTGTIQGVLNGVPIAATPFTTTIDNLAVGGSCSILNLDLGPLHLDLLGLVVDLNEVQLDITAVPGAGNLLGNLLCAVAGLLDNSGPLNGIGALLNRLLTGLGL
ncbi:ABC transporter substrate-binding protein [Microbacterium sp. B2969]|uniref:ABC transporter substrate-binding protein n=1 Tax=Microbacterium alkaliflavum TaxID=3248839 RepID=A0ABW7Q357_9MICO